MTLLRSLLTVLFLIALAGTASAEPAASSVLTVEQVSGEVRIDQLGETRLLQVGDVLHDRDVVRVGEGAYLSLRFTREGALELGPGAALAIERLPTAADAADLRSIFSLWQGYMHIVWRHPASTRWPLFVYFGGQRSSLVDGEYFFERDATRSRSCVAAGRLAVTAISGDAPETLRPSACYEIHNDGKLRTEPRGLESWVSVRQSFALNPDPAHPVMPFPTREIQPLAENPLAAAEPVSGPTPAPSLPAPAAAPPTAIIFTGKKPVTAVATAKPPAASPTPAAAPKPAASAAVVAAPAVPAPGPTAANDAGSSWAILIGSYGDPQNAAQVQQKLIAAGYTPFLRVKIVEGKTWNSVQVRGYTSREAAEAKMAVIMNKLGLPNLKVVLLP